MLKLNVIDNNAVSIELNHNLGHVVTHLAHASTVGCLGRGGDSGWVAHRFARDSSGVCPVPQCSSKQPEMTLLVWHTVNPLQVYLFQYIRVINGGVSPASRWHRNMFDSYYPDQPCASGMPP